MIICDPVNIILIYFDSMTEGTWDTCGHPRMIHRKWAIHIYSDRGDTGYIWRLADDPWIYVLTWSPMNTLTEEVWDTTWTSADDLWISLAGVAPLVLK